MGYENYISETEAAALAGVSPGTLLRFTETGYLQLETDSDGLRLFSKSALEKLFGLSSAAAQPQSMGEPKPQPLSVKAEELEPEVSAGSAASSVRPLHKNGGPLPPSSPTAPAVEALERELSKLKTINAMQEKLLDLKDQNLKEQQEQCQWLKIRIEKLEENIQREQFLLVSETQTVRRLIALHENRRSPVRLALEWLGFSTPQRELPRAG